MGRLGEGATLNGNYRPSPIIPTKAGIQAAYIKEGLEPARKRHSQGFFYKSEIQHKLSLLPCNCILLIHNLEPSTTKQSGDPSAAA